MFEFAIVGVNIPKSMLVIRSSHVMNMNGIANSLVNEKVLVIFESSIIGS